MNNEQHVALYQVNRLLTRRVRGSDWVYPALLFVMCSFIGVAAGVASFAGGDSNNGEEFRSTLCFIPLLVILLDLLLTTMRFQSNTLMEDRYLALLPIGKW